MKRLFQFILLFFTMTTVVPAQEKKSFTLEDVIPGGSNYYNLVPKSLPGTFSFITPVFYVVF